MITTTEFSVIWLRARFGSDERAASLVEYALLLALIAIVCLAAVSVMGQETANRIDQDARSMFGP